MPVHVQLAPLRKMPVKLQTEELTAPSPQKLKLRLKAQPVRPGTNKNPQDRIAMIRSCGVER